MSFKDELEKILRLTAKYDRAVDGDYMAAHFENKATQAIINLVDKEQLRLKANDVHVGQLMQENDEMRQAIRTLIKYGELS